MLKNKYHSLLFIACLLSIPTIAQTQLKTIHQEPTNYMLMLMITVALLLVFVIGILSNVLIMISKKALEKSKSAKKLMMIFVVAMGSMFSSSGFAQSATTSLADSVTKAPSLDFYGGVSYNTFLVMTTVIILELLVVFILVFFIKSLFRSLYPTKQVEVATKEIKQSWLFRTWHYLDKQFFTKAIPMEKEADLLLDHDYDGIKELDNALPPWWKYGFYITVLVAVIYFLKFEVWHTGMNPTEEYTAEMTTAKNQKDAYLALSKETVDENTVTALDAIGAAAGKLLFAKNCVPCHLSEGQGIVGPNLTDDYWIHGGSMKDIFKTIKYGFPDKGMQSWESTYSGLQIQQLTTYIKSLRGTNPPNPKAPQGDLYKELSPTNDTVSSTNNNDKTK